MIAQDSITLTDGKIQGFHAHIYYDAQTKEKAAKLRESLDHNFQKDVQLGRWHDRPTGPHPCWSYQVSFSRELLGKILSWLMLNRQGLTILVHPVTGDDLIDHSDYALWLGKQETLNLDVLR